MRTIKPECQCYRDGSPLRDEREDEVGEMIELVGKGVYRELTESALCPDAYLYAACRLMAVLLSTAHATALNAAGHKVSDDAVLEDVLKMLDDGSVLAGIRDSIMHARLHAQPQTVETRQ